MNILLYSLIGLTTLFGGLFYQNLESDNLGAFTDAFLSIQVGSSPTADFILSTDGTDSTWIEDTGGGGTGSVGTSTPDADTRVTYFTSNSATPALIGGEAAFTYDDALDLLTVVNASTTNLSATTFFGALVGNADTATALAANGGNCSAGSYPLGVDTLGAVESCTDATTEIDSAISTHAGDDNAHQELVTLLGEDYLSISTQAITANAIDLATSNVTGTLPIANGGTAATSLDDIVGTANEITVGNGANTIIGGDSTLSLPSAVYLGSSGQLGRDADNLIDFTTDNEIMFRTNATDNRLIIKSDGRVGIASSTPMSILGVAGTTTMETLNIDDPDHTGTSTVYIYSNDDSAPFGGEIILEDSDGAGCTTVYALNGVATWETVTCPTAPVAN